MKESQSFQEKIRDRGCVPGLTRIADLMERLGNVQDRLPVVHIAGTNGKGSVGTYMEAIFRDAGWNVGRYLSPAVFDPLEIIQRNGAPIEQKEYDRLMERVRKAGEELVSEGRELVTAFEAETAAAFLFFAEHPCDIVLLECGMGGAEDATNVISGCLASVITSIGFDHMQYLGTSLEEIARAKAGILKPGGMAFSAPQPPEVARVLRERAGELGCTFRIMKEEQLKLLVERPGELTFMYRDLRLTTSCCAHYQMINAALAAKSAFYLLKERLDRHDAMSMVELGHMMRGVAAATLPGRFEVLGEDPLFILDGAHNEAAARELLKTLENCFTNQKLAYIIGVLADKEYEKVLDIMRPYAEEVYTITPPSPRALDGEELFRIAGKYYAKVRYCEHYEDAVRLARESCKPVLAFGSLSFLGELKRVFLQDGKQDRV